MIATMLFILQPNLAKKDIRKKIVGSEKFVSKGVENSGVQKTTTVTKIAVGVRRQLENSCHRGCWICGQPSG